MYLSVCVRVCVREREREGEGEFAYVFLPFGGGTSVMKKKSQW